LAITSKSLKEESTPQVNPRDTIIEDLERAMKMVAMALEIPPAKWKLIQRMRRTSKMPIEW
jgi:hypothetical protein